MTTTTLPPLPPTLVGDRFAALGQALVTLLAGLRAEDWTRPTVAGHWRVRDVAAHLLDVGYRRLACGRDRHQLPPPAVPIRSEADLVRFLDGLNASWVAAAERLSPRLLVELHRELQPALAEHLAALDPWAEALFPVTWAGETTSATWFDVARELTEQWHHQQQIRLAVGAPPLDEPELSRPVFDTFLRALPRRYAETTAAPGTAVAITIQGRERYAWTLHRTLGGWELSPTAVPAPVTRIATDETSAWLGFTKALAPEEARRRAEVTGAEELALPFFATLAIMARREGPSSEPQ
jgi:uncharacterized protein (TIGR03083 family)